MSNQGCITIKLLVDNNVLHIAHGIYGSFSYSYDANGNRTTKGIDGHPENYTYDTASHHLLQTVNGGTRNYTYDANGNTISNTDRDFVYGENNRLKEAQLNGSPLASYTYNGRGERVLKQGTDTTLYIYDQNGQLIAELDDQGNTLREYIYIDGQPLGYVTNSQLHFIHTDHLGTPQVITDASQQVVWQADYEPFGQTTLTTQTVTYNQRFPGQYFDAETGLHYNYFRDYDPATGRYIQSDPIGLDGGLNTYLYVVANPLVTSDIYGLYKCECSAVTFIGRTERRGFRGNLEADRDKQRPGAVCDFKCTCNCELTIPPTPVELFVEGFDTLAIFFNNRCRRTSPDLNNPNGFTAESFDVDTNSKSIPADLLLIENIEKEMQEICPECK